MEQVMTVIDYSHLTGGIASGGTVWVLLVGVVCLYVLFAMKLAERFEGYRSASIASRLGGACSW